MADKEKIAPFNLFRAASVFSLILLLLIFILGLFNQHEVLFSLFGYQKKDVPMYLVGLWSFLVGALYVAILWILYTVRNYATIKSLKKTILDLKEKLNPTE
jgi:uncharacterized integral membrane protein